VFDVILLVRVLRVNLYGCDVMLLYKAEMRWERGEFLRSYT